MKSGAAEDPSNPALSRRRARTRSEILAAARAVFADKGYHEAGIAEIMQRADLGVGTYYLYFRDKHEAFVTVINEGLAGLRDRVLAQLDGVAEPTLALAAHTIFTAAYEERDLFHLALMDGNETLVTWNARSLLIDGFTGALAKAQADGRLPMSASVALLARFISGVITQAISWWFAHDTPLPDEMTTQVLGFLGGDALPATLVGTWPPAEDAS
jgi:AcrR family transcriptional regulator